jgi:hypothetical protein
MVVKVACFAIARRRQKEQGLLTVMVAERAHNTHGKRHHISMHALLD